MFNGMGFIGGENTTGRTPTDMVEKAQSTVGVPALL
jgi:hypothetical protein